MASAVVRPPLPLALIGLTAAAVGVANMFAWRSLKAKRLYLSQCDVALANPKLSNPDVLALDFEKQTADGSKEEFERYEWYVARLVYVLDECLRLCPTRREWQATAQTQLENHRDYFASDYYAEQDYLDHYSPRMAALIEEQRAA
jgi:hypothetical protein